MSHRWSSGMNCKCFISCLVQRLLESENTTEANWQLVRRWPISSKTLLVAYLPTGVQQTLTLSGSWHQIQFLVIRHLATASFVNHCWLVVRRRPHLSIPLNQYNLLKKGIRNTFKHNCMTIVWLKENIGWFPIFLPRCIEEEKIQ
jgi:hypothetical protein